MRSGKPQDSPISRYLQRSRQSPNAYVLPPHLAHEQFNKANFHIDCSPPDGKGDGEQAGERGNRRGGKYGGRGPA